MRVKVSFKENMEYFTLTSVQNIKLVGLDTYEITCFGNGPVVHTHVYVEIM